jgi:ketosteroid isomerase-like protein
MGTARRRRARSFQKEGQLGLRPSPVARLYKCCLLILATAPCVEGQIRNKFTRLQQEPNFVILREEAKMHRTRYLRLVMLVIVLGTTVLLGQAPEKAATRGEPTRTEDFATAMKKLRDTWVQEFNAGHADKVADLYAPEAVLMRRNGSVHNRDSILAELKRSILVQARNYTLESLHAEHSGDLGYDTGIYNESFPHHVAEGNYLMVVKRIKGEWKIVAHAAIPNPRQK